MKYALSALVSISCLAVSEVAAWGVLGHQTVALLAQNYLLPATVTKVQAILNDTSASYMGNVATWADEFRNEPGEGWSAGLHFIDPLDGPPPESCVIHEMDCPELGCVMTALANYTARVQDTTLDSTQHYEALKFIIHFMGDIAQPLHTEEFGLGANNLTVFYKGYQTNMHAAWDTSIPNSIMSLTPTSSITIADSTKFSQQLLKTVKSGGAYYHNVSSWISSWHIYSSSSPYSTYNTSEAITTTFAQESNNYVCGYALSNPHGPNAYNGTEISGAYTTGAVPIVEVSLARAGIRLAAWLNLIFSGKTGF